MKRLRIFTLALVSLICATAHAQLPSYLPAEGLVAWYPFNGNANDESGNGNDGVVNGATLTEDRFGNSNAAYNFNSSSISITNASIAAFGVSSFSVAAYFRTDLESHGDIIRYDNCAQGANWGIRVGYDYQGNGEFYNPGIVQGIETPSSRNPNYVSTNLTYNDNSWHSVVYVRDVTAMNDRIYIDGNFINQSSFSTVNDLNITGNPLLIGVCGGWYDFFVGKIDDIAIWNRALTEQEIQNFYTGTTPPPCVSLPSNLQQGLVGYWPFCGNANDESGNGNDGVVNGATLTQDRFGVANAAYVFDGVSNQIEVADNDALDFTNNYTLSAWYNCTNTGVLNQGLLGKANDFGGTGYQLLINPIVQFGYNNGLQVGAINGGAAIPFEGELLSDWHHVLGTYDGQFAKLYVDGQLVNETAVEYTLSPSNQLLLFGNEANSLARYFYGSLDDIGIWNRALTQAEVTQLYAVQSTGDPTAGGGNTTGPLANVPRGISYQAVARDAQGQAIVSTPVNVRFTLRQGTPTGTTEYSETHALNTNAIGLFNTYFGSGTAITSAFDSILWSNTTKFLQVEIDLGNGYVDMGTQQLISVPYAYRANEAAAAGTIRNNALPIHPDNTAALVGGLVAGEMYRTPAGVLMIVY